MTGRLSNQQTMSKLYYTLQQNGELKTVSGIPVTAPTQMRVHKGIENTLLFTYKKYNLFTNFSNLFSSTIYK
jgi:hypothetical protein